MRDNPMFNKSLFEYMLDYLKTVLAFDNDEDRRRVAYVMAAILFFMEHCPNWTLAILAVSVNGHFYTHKSNTIPK